MWTRDVEEEILATCRELDIGFVAYSPLGRGFLTGKIKSLDDLQEDDWRRHSPRFEQENLEHNLSILKKLGEIAAEKNCSLAQLALTWLLAQGDDIVPIAGTKRIKYLEENIKALEVQLTQDDLDRINEAAPMGAAKGLRYPEPSMQTVNR